MAAAKPNENEECDEDETDAINMAAKARSVTVKGLSSGTTSNDVMIYFQKKKNGGGEVEDVKLNEKERTAIVIFDERKVVENVLLKQHKIKDVNITVESLIKVFARVTANVDSEALGLNDEEIRHLLEKIRRETNIEFHFASFAYLMSGTFEQIAASRQHLQKEQLKRPRQKIPIKKKDGRQQSTSSFERRQDPQEESATSGSAVDQFKKSADEDEDEGYLTTENFMKMFQKVYKKQLENMTKDYKVEILQYSDPKGEMKVKVKSKDKRTDFQLRQAREEFITLYQTAQQNSKLVRFSTLDKNEANCSKLRRVIHNLNKELPVVIDRAADRVSYQIYGERDTVEQALQELHGTVGIKTNESVQLSGARSSTGQSSNLFDAEEAMDVDDDDFQKYEHYSGAVKISVLKGDITDQRVDVIVNAANENLAHGGGVAGAIVRKGGYSIQDDSDWIVRRYGPVKAGDVVDTEPGDLPCRKIIHAVGPMWKTEGEERSRKLLRAACINSLLKAEDLKLTSIAFPAISSGIFGMPKETSAEVMFAAIEEYASAKTSSKPVVTDVRFVIIDDPTVKVFREEFAFLYEGIDDNTPEQDEAKDMKSKRDPTMNKTRRHSRELYNPPRTKTGQINPGEKSDQDAVVERAGVAVDDKGGKRPLRGKKAQNEAFTQEKVFGHPLDGRSGGRDNNSPSSYSAVVKGKSSSSSSIKDQNPQRKTPNRENKHGDAQDKCPVCLDEIEEPKKLNKCGHTFCTACIDEAFKRAGKWCPVCKELYGVTVGNQPPGTMTWYEERYRSVPGYERYGVIAIDYSFYGGTQGQEHPNPGKYYTGTRRRAYLPACPEGWEVLQLLKRAFDARLLYTVGRSVTMGCDNQIIWNDVHHKTSVYGGPTNYGYPDPGYLSRVKEELAAKGIR